MWDNKEMDHISETLKERNIQLDTRDPVVQGGFTQVPNFILKNSKISLGIGFAPLGCDW